MNVYNIYDPQNPFVSGEPDANTDGSVDYTTWMPPVEDWPEDSLHGQDPLDGQSGEERLSWEMHSEPDSSTLADTETDTDTDTDFADASADSFVDYQAYQAYQPYQSYHPHPSMPDPAVENRRAPRRRRSTASLLALCLCCALLGGALGGLAGANLFNQPTAVVEDPVGNAMLETDAPRGTVVDPADPGEQATPENTKPNNTNPVVYQPGDVLTPAQIFELCNMGVVAISTETTGRNVFGQPATQASAGSGFIVSTDGYIITNNHVIEGATSITVMLADGKSYAAELIGRDSTNDLAVLKIEAQGLAALAWGDSSTLNVGDPVVAIGNPLGELANSMTSGIVSALDRSVNIDGTPMTMMQIDASVSPGNSGGPLIDQYGRVVGIVSAKNTGTGVEGIGFAIPEYIAKDIIEQLSEHGYVTGRPQLGIQIQPVDESMAMYYNLPVGIYVVSVDPGSCSEKAGMQTGDVIVAFGGEEVKTQEDLIGRKTAYRAGDTVEVVIVRAGQEITLVITLDETQPENEQSVQPNGNMPPWMQGQGEDEM